MKKSEACLAKHGLKQAIRKEAGAEHQKKRLGTENQSQPSFRTLEPQTNAIKEKLRLMLIFKGLSGKSKDGLKSQKL
jgi:hypothetical protein